MIQFEDGKTYKSLDPEDRYIYRCDLWSDGKLYLTYTYNDGMTETYPCTKYSRSLFEEVPASPYRNDFGRRLVKSEVTSPINSFQPHIENSAEIHDHLSDHEDDYV